MMIEQLIPKDQATPLKHVPVGLMSKAGPSYDEWSPRANWILLARCLECFVPKPIVS